MSEERGSTAADLRVLRASGCVLGAIEMSRIKAGFMGIAKV
jgi:hypothetical protein